MDKSRTQYSAYNISIGMVSRFASIIMGYVVRIIFTRVLSENYVGVNGLFTDILNVLALSEMGIETAVAYALYGPIARGDIETQKSIMKLYKWFYRFVAVFVLVAGLMVIPFMDVIIKNKPDIDNLIYIYILYLGNTVMSYLLVYKKTLLDAHQLKYIGTLANTTSWIIQDILQIIVLITTKNFVFYLYMNIIATLGANIYISKKTDKMYPYVKSRDIQPLDKGIKQDILKNVKAMMMHKIGNVAVNNTDNLLISSLVGITSVASYSNYYLLIGAIRNILYEAVDGITASVGNLAVTSDKNRVRKIFNVSIFASNWLFCLTAICMYELLNPFVKISFGEKYLFSMDVVFILCINLYITGAVRTCKVFLESLGLFWYDRYKSIAEAAINLIVSLILGYRFGVAGIFAGTFVSCVTTTLWVEPYVIFKYHFKEKVSKYFTTLAGYFLVTAFVWFTTHWIIVYTESLFGISSIVLIIFWRFIVILIAADLMLLAVYFKDENFRFAVRKLKGLVKKLKKDC